jgi:hypothetical protein
VHSLVCVAIAIEVGPYIRVLWPNIHVVCGPIAVHIIVGMIANAVPIQVTVFAGIVRESIGTLACVPSLIGVRPTVTIAVKATNSVLCGFSSHYTVQTLSILRRGHSTNKTHQREDDEKSCAGSHAGYEGWVPNGFFSVFQ